MNRFGGDGIPGPGAVPRSGANPGKLKHSLSCVLLWTPHLYDNVASIAGCFDFLSGLLCAVSGAPQERRYGDKIKAGNRLLYFPPCTRTRARTEMGRPTGV